MPIKTPRGIKMKKTLLMLIFSGLSISVFADYYICYGSFRNQANAFAESAALQAAGIESAVVEMKTDGAVLYRVIHPKGYADSDSAKWKIKYIVAGLETPYPTQESFWVFESDGTPKTAAQTGAPAEETAEFADGSPAEGAAAGEVSGEPAAEETDEASAGEAVGEVSGELTAEETGEAFAGEAAADEVSGELTAEEAADGEVSEELTVEEGDETFAEEAADGEVSEELTVEESDETLVEEAADGEVSEELTVEEGDETFAEEAADSEVSEELTVEEGDETLAEEAAADEVSGELMAEEAGEAFAGEAAGEVSGELTAEEADEAFAGEIRFTLKNQSVSKTLFDSPAAVYAVIPEELTRGKAPVDFTVNLYRDRERVASKTGDFISNLNKFSITETFPEAMFNDVTRTCEYTIELIFNGEVIAENSYLYFID